MLGFFVFSVVIGALIGVHQWMNQYVNEAYLQWYREQGYAV